MALRQKLLNSDRPMLGSFLGMASPALVEMLCRAGFDFIILDLEHGAFGQESLEACLRSASLVKTPCLVRIPALEAHLIQSALDLGAAGVQVPGVESAQQAGDAVGFSCFPPHGKRGFGSATRAADYGFMPRPRVCEAAQNELMVNIQIESRAGVANLPAILKTRGLDVVFIGTSDLSLDYGYASPDDPAMLPLIEKLISDIASSGKTAGIHISDWSRIGTLRRLGARYFTTAAPLAIKQAFVNQVQQFAVQTSGG